MKMVPFHLEILMRVASENTYHPENPKPNVQQAIFDLSQLGLVKSFDNNRIGQITEKGKAHTKALLSLEIQ